MKNFTGVSLALVALTLALPAQAQDVSGRWEGELPFSGVIELQPFPRDYVAERADLGRPEPATMPRGTWRRTALAPGADWRVARARAWELARAATAELATKGLALEPSTTFERSGSGRPVAVLLQLEEALDDPPEGWRTLPARPGAQVMLRSVRQVRYETLQALRRAAGGGTAAPLMVVPEAGSPDRSVAVFIAAKSTR